jgi:hypothetical protein
MNALTTTLISELRQAPDDLKGEVLDFVLFLKSRRNEVPSRSDLLPLANSSWAADWDTEAEDAAWRDL